jgi:hypothetical protein
MQAVNAEQAMYQYSEAYQRLYKRTPRDIRALDHEWVVVNGARMRAMELEYLTQQLEREYMQSVNQKRSLVNRLLNFFKQ